MRNARGAVTNLRVILLLVLGWAGQAGATPITTFNLPVHFTANYGANSVGLPVGAQQFVGVVNVSPTAGTTVTATQGLVTRPLPFTPFTSFPTQFRSIDPFDAALTGSWSITATNGPDSAGPILTNPIPNPQLLPLALNLQVVGTGETPTVTWTLPNLTGFDVEATRIHVYDDTTDDVILNTRISGTPTQFTIPSGVMVPGVPYIFSVNLQDEETFPSFQNTLENRSTAFAQSPYLVPEPATAALLAAGLAGFGAWGSRRRHASERTVARTRA